MRMFILSFGMMASCGLSGCNSAPAAKETAVQSSRTDKPVSGDATAPTSKGPTINRDGTLILPPETEKALAIQTVSVRKINFQGARAITFQIFREAEEKPLPGLIYRTGYAYASVLCDPRQPGLKLEEPADVSLPNAAGVSVPARIVEIDQLPAAAGHQQEAILEILDSGNHFELGQFCSAAFSTTPISAALVIPRAALLSASDGTFVYLQTEKGFQRTAVKTGAQHETDIQIEDGLKEGDQVVISPVQGLWLTELQLRGGEGG